MKVIHNNHNFINNQESSLKSIALTLNNTNVSAFAFDLINPFFYLKKLEEYGIKAKATSLVIKGKVVGYKFQVSRN